MNEIIGVRFTVYGEAVGKGRPRFVRQGNFTKVVTPEKTRVHENIVRMEYERQCRGCWFPRGRAIAMDVEVFTTTPRSASKQKTADMLSGAYHPAHKPDCDNILKLIADSLNGVAYEDDRQIVAISMKKHYGEQAKMVIAIRDIGMAG